MNSVRDTVFSTAVLLIACIAVASPARADMKKSEQAADRVAIVNGSPIARGDFEREVFQIQKTVLGLGKPISCSQVASIRTEVLESMIITEEMAALRQQFPTNAEFTNELARRNMSEEALRSQMERNSTLQQYVEKRFSAKVTVTDAETVGYYESNLDLFKQPLQARISHILIQSDIKWDDTRKPEARRKAEQVLKSLKKGQDFGALAREQSDGPTRTNGGDLGYIRKGQLEAKLDEAVFTLKAGETSDIVETDYGFHVFKAADRKPETILAYDAVKEQIREHLVQEKARQEADKYAKTLREKASVEILLRDEVNVAKKP
jgi:parvulin-like peptidyl-prolyl isomerase